jgi:hypothetical protein
MTQDNPERWRSKIDALTRLAEDQRGKPEGDLARQKLIEIINKHPEAANYKPVQDLVERDLTMGDVDWMQRHGVPTQGSWTGRNLEEAIAMMEAEYKQRIARAKRKKITSPVLELKEGDDG